jgi:8-oxo-dGTP pyrophosphatase MutT (NUDIX family)
MKTKPHIANVVLIVKDNTNHSTTYLLLGKKHPKRKSDLKRKNQKMGDGKWVPPGGKTEFSDKSQKHAAQREIFQETGLFFPLSSFGKVGVLRGYLDQKILPIWLVHLYIVIVDKPVLPTPNEEYVDMQWFLTTKLPFEAMLAGDRKWIPRIIRGEKLSVKIFFKQETGNLLSTEIKKIRSFN